MRWHSKYIRDLFFSVFLISFLKLFYPRSVSYSPTPRAQSHPLYFFFIVFVTGSCPTRLSAFWFLLTCRSVHHVFLPHFRSLLDPMAETEGILFLLVTMPRLSCATMFCRWHCCGLTFFFFCRNATKTTLDFAAAEALAVPSCCELLLPKLVLLSLLP